MHLLKERVCFGSQLKIPVHHSGKSWQWKTGAASQIIASKESEGNSLMDMPRILSPE